MLPLLMRMALPAIAAQFVNMLYSIVDRIYIGHIAGVGTQALAGVGVCNTVILLVAAFAQFTGGGGAPLSAIALGKGQKEKAERILGNGILLLIVLSVLLMAAVYAFMDPILMATGASDTTLPYAHSYLSIYMTGTFFVMVAIGLNPFINVVGHPGIAMASVLIGAALNIVLDPVFIFALDMGVAGAALATVISQAVSAVWILQFLLRRQDTLRIGRSSLKPDAESLRQMGALGVSPFVMASTESIIGFVMNRGLVTYGDAYVSALTIMQSCMMIVSVPSSGFTSGTSPVISYNYGHGNVERVREGAKITFIIMTGFNLALILWMILMPRISGSSALCLVRRRGLFSTRMRDGRIVTQLMTPNSTPLAMTTPRSRPSVKLMKHRATKPAIVVTDEPMMDENVSVMASAMASFRLLPCCR